MLQYSNFYYSKFQINKNKFSYKLTFNESLLVLQVVHLFFIHFPDNESLLVQYQLVLRSVVPLLPQLAPGVRAHSVQVLWKTKLVLAVVGHIRVI